jgi:hypothetical protein
MPLNADILISTGCRNNNRPWAFNNPLGHNMNLYPQNQKHTVWTSLSTVEMTLHTMGGNQNQETSYFYNNQPKMRTD